MKKLFTLLSVLTLVAGCDAPQRSRGLENFRDMNAIGGPTGGNTSGTSGWTDPGTTTGGTTAGTTSGTTSGVTSGTTGGTPSPGFETCSLSDKYQTPEIGPFGLCQSTSDETIFRLRFSMTSDRRTCLIPSYKDAGGSSTFIGQPQCTFTEANKILQGPVAKNRPGFENYPLNGVIVMKELLLPEYFQCMNGYLLWIEQACAVPPQGMPEFEKQRRMQYCGYWRQTCPYSYKTNPACAQEARNYMNQICTSFKSRFANSYLDIRLK
ncbi:MAG TPA: hypothetical protein VNJ01_05450 [Bacteriovoracaceae bacterium]|nr:hypothetical protein [Bacteriovoracaceae bacterium]